MKIQKIDLQNFMIFQDLDIEFSPNINVISGENSTGKTALIKLLYANVKSLELITNSKGDFSKEKIENTLVSKLQGVLNCTHQTVHPQFRSPLLFVQEN